MKKIEKQRKYLRKRKEVKKISEQSEWKAMIKLKQRKIKKNNNKKKTVI